MVHEGTLASLRRIKDTVDEVSAPQECGVGAEDFSTWQVGGKRQSWAPLAPPLHPWRHAKLQRALPPVTMWPAHPPPSAPPVQEGDSIECFQLVSKARRLEEAKAATAVDVATIGA